MPNKKKIGCHEDGWRSRFNVEKKKTGGTGTGTNVRRTFIFFAIGHANREIVFIARNRKRTRIYSSEWSRGFRGFDISLAANKLK